MTDVVAASSTPPTSPNAQPATVTPAPNQILQPSKVLLEWEAPERLFQKKPREFYRKTAVMIIFFALLFLIIFDFLLIGLLGVVFFATYVFRTIPPRMVKHQITTYGINYASQHLYEWKDLRDFFIDQKQGVYILNVNTVAVLPGRLFLILPEQLPHKKVLEMVNQYLSFVEKPKPTAIEKMADKIASKINF